jgi:hypothetical protein
VFACKFACRRVFSCFRAQAHTDWLILTKAPPTDASKKLTNAAKGPLPKSELVIAMDSYNEKQRLAFSAHMRGCDVPTLSITRVAREEPAAVAPCSSTGVIGAPGCVVDALADCYELLVAAASASSVDTDLDRAFKVNYREWLNIELPLPNDMVW